MDIAHTIDRSELAIWAEGTQYSVDDLARMYAKYVAGCVAADTEPLAEGAWANQVLGIPD
jgi:hypothetical protein